jgi:hypothetical protein
VAGMVMKTPLHPGSLANSFGSKKQNKKFVFSRFYKIYFAVDYNSGPVKNFFVRETYECVK